MGGYGLRLQFDDATEQIVDFGPFLRDAQHPLPDVGTNMGPLHGHAQTLETASCGGGEERGLKT